MSRKKLAVVAALASLALLAAFVAWRLSSNGGPEGGAQPGVVHEGQVIAVAAVGQRVFFVATQVDAEKHCEPACYVSELRELARFGGTPIGKSGGQPRALGVSETHALWGANGFYNLDLVAGDKQEKLAVGGDRVALDDTHAFFAGRELVRIELATGKRDTLVIQASAVDVALDRASVYFVDEKGTTLWRVPKDGGPKAPLAKELEGATRVVVGGDRVYVAAKDAIWSFGPDGSGKKKVADVSGDVAALGWAGGKLDWVTFREREQAAVHSTASAQELQRFDAPTVDAGASGRRQIPPGLASTDAYVFVTAANGLLRIER